MSEGFSVTPWLGMVFFKYCLKYNVNSDTDKIQVLRRLVAKKKAKYLPHPEQSLKGKRILDLRGLNFQEGIEGQEYE